MVFAAEDIVLRRQVAVKVLHPAVAADTAFLRRFQVEAQLAAALRHPNVLAVYDWGEGGGAPFLVTELLEGGSLNDLINQGVRVTPSQALQVGLEACRGLDHAHRRGLVHRDIKPANLLFDDEGSLRIADFGIARAMAELAVTEPLGLILGTARYTSPEQVEGRVLDGRSDVYSLALVLIEAITGAVPFAAETSASTLLARLERPLEPPAAVGQLAEALAAAGHRDRESRVDAAGFGRLLKAAALQMERPGALPLVRLGSAEAALKVAEALTVHAAGTSTGGDIGIEIDFALDGVEDGRGGQDSEDDESLSPSPIRAAVKPVAEPARHSRRRRLLIPFLVMLLIAGLAAGAAVVQPWQPTLDVPDVLGLPPDAAKARLRALGLGLKVDGRSPSETVEDGRVVAAQPVRQRRGRDVKVLLSSGPADRPLAAVVGRSADEVGKVFTSVGLLVVVTPVDSETVGVGTIVTMEPPAGSLVPRGGTVRLTVSAGPPARPVPDLRAKSLADATAALAAVGLKGTSSETFDDKVAAGKVIGTNPVAGTAVRPGLAVVIGVSKGRDLVTVPVVAGLTPTAAQKMLSDAGLVTATTYGPPSGKVFSAQPASGSRVVRGSSVALYTK